MSLGKTP